MAKKKGRKGEKDKLPKKIAGVKVPKELRKSGSGIAKLAQEPLVRELALAALAAGLAARKDARRAAKKAAREAGDAPDGAGAGATETSVEGAGWVKAALGAAAIEAGKIVVDALEDAAARSKKAGGTDGKGGKSNVDKMIEVAATVAGGLRH
jgi:hypothetical protein